MNRTVKLALALMVAASAVLALGALFWRWRTTGEIAAVFGGSKPLRPVLLAGLLAYSERTLVRAATVDGELPRFVTFSLLSAFLLVLALQAAMAATYLGVNRLDREMVVRLAAAFMGAGMLVRGNFFAKLPAPGDDADGRWSRAARRTGLVLVLLGLALVAAAAALPIKALPATLAGALVVILLLTAGQRRAAARLGAVGAVAVASLLVLAPPAKAEPALWVVRDADTTIYLFGSIHALKPDVQWRSAKLDKALADSGEVVVEAVVPDDPRTLAPLIMQLGYDPDGSLAAKLDPEARERLTAAAQKLGFPDGALDLMRPWMAATTLGAAPLVRAGWDPKLGPDLALQAQAKAAGKSVLGLESVEQQARFLADMPEPEQVRALGVVLRNLEQALPMAERLQAAWLSGDRTQLQAISAELRAQRSPDFDKIIRLDRNRAWAARIKDRLQAPGTVLMVVGAGHLLGPGGLGEVLAADGLTMTPL